MFKTLQTLRYFIQATRVLHEKLAYVLVHVYCNAYKTHLDFIFSLQKGILRAIYLKKMTPEVQPCNKMASDRFTIIISLKCSKTCLIVSGKKISRSTQLESTVFPPGKKKEDSYIFESKLQD